MMHVEQLSMQADKREIAARGGSLELGLGICNQEGIAKSSLTCAHDAFDAIRAEERAKS